MSHTRLIEREGGNIMKHSVKITACLLLLLALCGCGNYEARLEGAWQGDGSLDVAIEVAVPFNGAEQWVFDGKETAIATVKGKRVDCHYYATDDTLTLNAGEEASCGVQYELKGNTLRIGNAIYTKVK